MSGYNTFLFCFVFLSGFILEVFMVLVNCLICRSVFYDASQILQVVGTQQPSRSHLSRLPFSALFDVVVGLSWD